MYNSYTLFRFQTYFEGLQFFKIGIASNALRYKLYVWIFGGKNNHDNNHNNNMYMEYMCFAPRTLPQNDLNVYNTRPTNLNIPLSALLYTMG